MFQSTGSPPTDVNRSNVRHDFKTPKSVAVGSHSLASRGRPENLSYQSSSDQMSHTRNSGSSGIIGTESFTSISDDVRPSYSNLQQGPRLRELPLDANATINPGEAAWRQQQQNAAPGDWYDDSLGFQRSRLSDPGALPPGRRNLSITDADKLEQRGHIQTGVHHHHERVRTSPRQFHDDTYRTSSDVREPVMRPPDFLNSYQQLHVPYSAGVDRAHRTVHAHNENVGWSTYNGSRTSQDFQTMSLGRHSSGSNINISSDTHSALEAVQKAADDIIREKDSIIEWQKRQLEQRHSAIATTAAGCSDMAVGLRLQELQYENASLKVKLTELMAARKCDKDTFDSKLGAAEYELRELKLSVDGQARAKVDVVKQLESKVAEKESLIEDWKGKYIDMKAKNDDLVKKLSSSKRYLEDLPTVEEHKSNLDMIKTLKEEKQKAEAEQAQLNKRLAAFTKGQQARDQMIGTLQQTQQRQKADFEKLKKENEELQLKLSADKDFLQLRQLQADNDKLKADLDSAKKLLDTKQLQLQQQNATFTQDIKTLQERVDQETATVTALRQELTDKELQLKKSVQSYSELNREHQRLTERCLQTEDQMNELKQQNSPELIKMQRHLLAELTACFLDLESLVTVCLQGANGEEPDFSSLLGIRQSTASAELETGEGRANAVNALSFRISKVKQLRMDLDKLRTVVSDRFAEDMGRRLTCNPQ